MIYYQINVVDFYYARMVADGSPATIFLPERVALGGFGVGEEFVGRYQSR